MTAAPPMRQHNDRERVQRLARLSWPVESVARSCGLRRDLDLLTPHGVAVLSPTPESRSLWQAFDRAWAAEARGEPQRYVVNLTWHGVFMNDPDVDAWVLEVLLERPARAHFAVPFLAQFTDVLEGIAEQGLVELRLLGESWPLETRVEDVRRLLRMSEEFS